MITHLIFAAILGAALLSGRSQAPRGFEMRQRDQRKGYRWTVALVAWVLLAYPVPGECALYATDNLGGGTGTFSRLLRIDPADASFTVVGTVPNLYAGYNYSISGLAYNTGDGFLYGTDNGWGAGTGSRLLRINPADASSTVMGYVPNWYETYGVNLAISSLAYNPADGFLYSTNENVPTDSRLLRINPADASSTIVGTVPNWYETYGQNLPISGLAYNPADGFLYGTDSMIMGVSSHLLRINPADASSTIVGAVPNWYETYGVNVPIRGLAYNPADGFLYGTDMPDSRLLRIDPADASSTVVGTIPNYGTNLRIGTLAYVPTTHFLGTGVLWPATPENGLIDGIADAVNLQQTFDDRLRFPDTTDTTSLQLHSSVDAHNLGLFKTALGDLTGRVSPGDTVILSFSSHGGSSSSGQYVELSPDDGDRLYDLDLLALLQDSPFNAVKKIVILDSCFSGGFGPDLAAGLTNIAVLAACEEGAFAFAASDGTGFFTNAIIDGLTKSGNYFRADTNPHDGVLTLDELEAYVNAYDFGDLIGQEMPLKELGGTAPFTGINMVLFTSPDFDGVIGASMPEPGTLMLLALGGLALLRRRAA